MSTKKVYLVLRLIGLGVSFGILRLGSLIAARIHRRTYKAVAEPKQVVVVGGSFAGFFLAKQLAESLPTGYRVVLIEKHSHFHFTWNFPRISVVSGHDHEAFVPYGKQPPLAPDGVYAFRQGTVIKLDKDKATLEDGSIVKYEYLALATGSQGRYPYRLGPGDDKAACMDFFRRRQERIEHAQDIVIVGGGAAGVEVAGDTKSKYPQKKVTLVHSREHLLNSFGPGLHERAKQALEEMGVKIYLSERVTSAIDEEAPAAEVTLRSGKTLQCDALIRCTGQSPRSDLVAQFSPSSISPSGAVLVRPTLQLDNSPSPKVFALGDVIELPGTHCPKLGRPASFQGMFVADNIVRMIKKNPLKTYTPGMMDNSIELTLGLGRNVMYISDGATEISFSKKVADVSMHASQMWKLMDVQPFKDPADAASDKPLAA